MDAETMERLLIDRRIGELSPDSERLLDAYVQIAPGANVVMAEINDVLELAGRALGPVPQIVETALPPLSIDDALHRENQGRTRLFTGWARPVAFAASIALAFLLGTRLSAPSTTHTPERTEGIAQSFNGVPADAREFWSVTRYASEQTVPRPSGGPRIEWKSPLIWPQLGEKL